MRRTERRRTVESGGAPRSLRREITWALTLKTVALVVLYLAFFGPSHRIAATPDRIASAFLQSAPSPERH